MCIGDKDQKYFEDYWQGNTSCGIPRTGEMNFSPMVPALEGSLIDLVSFDGIEEYGTSEPTHLQRLDTLDWQTHMA